MKEISAQLGFDTRTKCPACHHESFKKIYELPFSSDTLRAYINDFYGDQGNVNSEFLENQQFSLAKCDECELIFQVAIPNDSLMEELYERWLDPQKVFNLHENNRPKHYYAKLADEISTLIDFFNKRPHELKFFDFGLGWSNWCKMAMAFGLQVSGTELSETRIKHAEKYGIEVLNLEEFIEQKFDFINTEQVFEHIPKPLEMLKELKNGLKPGGLIKISVPNGFDIERRLEVNDWKAPKGSINSLNPVAPLEHINCFKRENIIKMARLAGLKEVDLNVIPKLVEEDKPSLVEEGKKLLRPLKKALVNEKYPFAHTYVFFTHESQ